MTIATPPPEGAMSLGLAIVASSNAPMLSDGQLLVVAGSASFCRDFEIDPAALENKPPLAEIGKGEWNLRTLSTLLEATVSGSAAVHA